MAIFGIGAYHEGDVTENFVQNNIIGTGWTINTAPELHQYFVTLKVGDIIYIKAAFGGAENITVKAIGLVRDNIILNSENNELTEIGRNVKWLVTEKFIIPRPIEKNNVRSNTVYEEFHPLVQQAIIDRL